MKDEGLIINPSVVNVYSYSPNEQTRVNQGSQIKRDSIKNGLGLMAINIVSDENTRSKESFDGTNHNRMVARSPGSNQLSTKVSPRGSTIGHAGGFKNNVNFKDIDKSLQDKSLKNSLNHTGMISIKNVHISRKSKNKDITRKLSSLSNSVSSHDSQSNKNAPRSKKKVNAINVTKLGSENTFSNMYQSKYTENKINSHCKKMISAL